MILQNQVMNACLFKARTVNEEGYLTTKSQCAHPKPFILKSLDQCIRRQNHASLAFEGSGLRCNIVIQEMFSESLCKTVRLVYRVLFGIGKLFLLTLKLCVCIWCAFVLSWTIKVDLYACWSFNGLWPAGSIVAISSRSKSMHVDLNKVFKLFQTSVCQVTLAWAGVILLIVLTWTLTIASVWTCCHIYLFFLNLLVFSMTSIQGRRWRVSSGTLYVSATDRYNLWKPWLQRPMDPFSWAILALHPPSYSALEGIVTITQCWRTCECVVLRHCHCLVFTVLPAVPTTGARHPAGSPSYGSLQLIARSIPA